MGSIHSRLTVIAEETQGTSEMADGIPARPIQDVDLSNPFFTSPLRESLQPSIMSVDGQRNLSPSGMDEMVVDPTVYIEVFARNSRSLRSQRWLRDTNAFA